MEEVKGGAEIDCREVRGGARIGYGRGEGEGLGLIGIIKEVCVCCK